MSRIRRLHWSVGGALIAMTVLLAQPSDGSAQERARCGQHGCGRCEPPGRCSCRTPSDDIRDGWNRFWHASDWVHVDEYLYYRPLGSIKTAHADTQTAVGVATLMTLYDYDFGTGEQCSMLTSRGMYQLRKIASVLPANHFPVVIEEIAGKPALNEARRLQAVESLHAMSCPIQAERVVVGRPEAPGLDGNEAVVIHESMLLDTAAGGATIGTGSGGAGSGSYGSGSYGSGSYGSGNSGDSSYGQ